MSRETVAGRCWKDSPLISLGELRSTEGSASHTPPPSERPASAIRITEAVTLWARLVGVTTCDHSLRERVPRAVIGLHTVLRSLAGRIISFRSILVR